MHASQQQQQQKPKILFLMNFKICTFITKKTLKKKKLDLYLMKIQISFEF